MPDDFETVPVDPADIQAEFVENGYIDAVGEYHDFEQETEAETLSTENVQITEEGLEVDLYSHILEAQDINALSDVPTSQVMANDVRASAPLPDGVSFFVVNISGSEYRWYPSDNFDHIVVCDGHLVNMGSSAVTGLLVSVNERLNIDSYQKRFLTINALNSTGSQNNAYRNNSYAYTTTYSPGLNNNLSSSVVYVQVDQVKAPRVGSDLTPYQILIGGCLLALVFINLIGGILRHD